MRLHTNILLVFLTISGAVYGKSDIEIVKQRVLTELLSKPVDDAIISALIQSNSDDGSWQEINYEDLSRTGFENRKHLGYLKDLCLAYNKKSSSHYHSRKLLKVVHRSLDYWCENDFICENWWYNQIFTPTMLVDILLLMDKNIEGGLKAKALIISERGNLNAPGARPGGDRIKIGGIAAKRGLAVGDEDSFAEIMKVINSEIKFNTGGRGMQHDYSFHHRADRVNTTYSYGNSYARVFAEWAANVAGTIYAFSDDKIKQLTDYYLDGICKQLVYGAYTEKGSVNRSLARVESFSALGTEIPENILKATDYRKDELENIVAQRKGEKSLHSSFAQYYWQSEHFVLQRNGFYTSVRMYSNRNQNMEDAHNSEGLKNHHKGDGANFLSIKGDEYLNIWPVYDWQKIPGATILQKPILPPANEIRKIGISSFVGAVTDGMYAAVAFDFTSTHDFLRAKKGWFFFDDLYVCLGAGIESPSHKHSVATTLNQNLLQGAVIVSTNNEIDTLTTGTHELEDVDWVLHNGTAYMLPEPTTIQLSNQTEQGRWTDISKQSVSPKELITKDVFKLWIDHGARPQGNVGGLNYASTIPKDVCYQYIVVPETSVEQLKEETDIEILVNNRDMQAVKNRKSGIVQAIFYKAGMIEIEEGVNLRVDSPGAIMLRMENASVKELTVSDPSRTLANFHFQISGMDAFNIEMPAGVYAGKSVSVDL